MGNKKYAGMPLGWILLLLPLTIRCQQPFAAGMPAYFTWGSYNQRQNDAFCFSSNTAALARCSTLAAGLSAERPYGITSLARFHLAAIIPARSGSVGVQAAYFSAMPYRETVVSLAYGRKLGSVVDLGVQAAMARTSVPAYAARSYFTASAGLILHLTSQVSSGWNVSVPRQGGGIAQALLPSPRYSMGIAYDASVLWSAAMEISRDAGSGFVAGTGFIYRPHRLICIRMGFTTGGPPVWFGIGYELKMIRLDITASVHDRLGFSPAIGLQYQTDGK
ncbi:MAG: hypothetical protein EOO05_00860 [Chitinophagaceae bacterium]|nr:MAG: hypothetical protein EOO05_00860 [Chitinophagaceae bacterium]